MLTRPGVSRPRPRPKASRPRPRPRPEIKAKVELNSYGTMAVPMTLVYQCTVSVIIPWYTVFGRILVTLTLALALNEAKAKAKNTRPRPRPNASRPRPENLASRPRPNNPASRFRNRLLSQGRLLKNGGQVSLFCHQVVRILLTYKTPKRHLTQVSTELIQISYNHM